MGTPITNLSYGVFTVTQNEGKDGGETKGPL